MLDDLLKGMTTLMSTWEAAVTDLWLSEGQRSSWLAADAQALAAARMERLKEAYMSGGDLGSLTAPTLLYAGTNDIMAAP